jgi:predicted transcriptional regulator
MAESVALYVRVTPEQHAKLKRIAEQKDRPIAWVIRNMIDRVAEPK